MKIKEVFENPTVKQIIYQVRYPATFFIEDKIGDYQIKVMDKFPKSSIIYKHNILISSGIEKKEQIDSLRNSEDFTGKTWQFENESSNLKVGVNIDSLSITSDSHKTYNQENGRETLRSVIEHVISNFLEVIPIPKFTRIGLRYINIFALPENSSKCLESFFKTNLPVSRFALEDSDQIKVFAITKGNDNFLRYNENIKMKNGKIEHILDLDAYSANVFSNDYLEVSDDLHLIIRREFENVITEKLVEFMRKAENNDDR